MLLKVKIVLVTLVATCVVHAQNMRLSLDPSMYVTAQGKPYVDLYTTLDASTIGFELNADSNWVTSFKVVVQTGGKLDAFTFNYAQEDSASGAPLLLQKSTFAFEDWTHQVLKIVITDDVTGDFIELEDTLHFGGEEAYYLSDPIALDTLESDNVVYQKSGSAVIPKPSLGLPVFENVPIEWYSEVYIKEGQYVLRYELQNASGDAVAGTQGFKRLQDGVNPIRISYAMDGQNSGAYAIKTELLDASGTVIKEASESLMWYNDEMLIDASLLEGVLTRATFEKSWGNWDEVPEYLSMIAPLASLAERRLLMNLKESMDTARAAFYLTRFWQEKAPDQALESWIGYKRVVDQVDAEFGSKTLPGYRTQMGRVFLQYGAPSLVEERPFDGKNYPYQIWQYDRLVSSSTPIQQNQVFVFVDQELVGRQYTLIHSSAMGEVKDHKWQFHLSRHSNTGPDIDATSTQYSRDNFGERISNSLIIGNQGTWFDQFNN